MDEASNPGASIEQHFGTLVDPRQAMNQEHLFLEILVVAICAIIAGADDWEAVADFGRANLEWFSRFLSLPHGIPSHDTFWRVFRLLDPLQFETCFLAWVQDLMRLTDGEVVAIDGKK